MGTSRAEGGDVIGETLGNYEVQDVIGAGGMGTVYLATHKLIGRRAAIKVLLPELSAQRDMVTRFFNEARSTAHIKHAGLIDVFDFGFHDSGCAYLAMEFLEGSSLAALLRGEPRQPAELVAAIGRQVASAVGAAHARGIVHRDLKPDNIFLVPDDEVAFGLRAKVLDFGIAKLTAERGAATRTRTGSIMGTPAYMSPEQCRGSGAVDARTDIYSLGCVLYEMAAGRMPFAHEGMGELLMAHMVEAPVPPTQLGADIPADLEAIILRALEKDPDRRPQSMEELARSLGARVTGRGLVAAQSGARTASQPGNQRTTLGSSVVVRTAGPRPAPSRRWLVGAAALLVAGALTGTLLWRARARARPHAAAGAGVGDDAAPAAPGSQPTASIADAAVASDAAPTAETAADAGAPALDAASPATGTAPAAARRHPTPRHGRPPVATPGPAGPPLAPTPAPTPAARRHNTEGPIDPFGGP